MDATRFDTLVRSLTIVRSRRGALATLLAGTLGLLSLADMPAKAGKHSRRKRRPARTPHEDAGRVAAAAADCLSPGPSANLKGCNFDDAEFGGIDLSGSTMRGTTFRGANLCGADLSSAQLKDADFRGLGAGNTTDLTRADLHSSGCKGTLFDANTIFCRTITCTGAIRDDDCPDGVDPEEVCCADADCPGGVPCQHGVCSPVCPVASVFCSGDVVAGCGSDANCICTIDVNGAHVCQEAAVACIACTTNDECDDVTGVPGSFCVVVAPGCCRFALETACVKPCPTQP